MITIPLRITGETWYNTQDFYDAIQQLPPDECVLIDVNSEGPCLGMFGVFDILAKHYNNDYVFTKWSNPYEPNPYPTIKSSKMSHFFKLSKHYWTDEIPNTIADCTFGLFVGRNSSARNYIMWDAYSRWNNKFLMSKMPSPGQDIWATQLPMGAIDLDPITEWADDSTLHQLKNWWEQNLIPSIDDKSVRDQYHHPEASAANCISSLLGHYHRFNFELVCESYTRGTTFFPTEKTIRAIMGNKPFVVYGPKNYLQNLQKLGFKTFSGVWNEQYDQTEGVQRWQQMRSIIDMICNWDNGTRQNVLTQCASITKHNRNRLLEIINDC